MTAADIEAELAELLAQPYRVPDEKLIRQPGVYDIPMRDYLADPVAGGSLSRSAARTITEPGGPARLRWRLDHPSDDSAPSQRFGRLVHHLVLGDAAEEFAVIHAPDWRTREARAELDAAEAAGLAPVKAEAWARAEAMAAAIAANPTAAGLIHSASGKPEQTLIWRDELTGVWCRARVDWFRTPRANTRLLIVDYKTHDGIADGYGFARPAANYGYFLQAAWYIAGVRALGLDDDPAFLLIVQEKTPPYLVNVVEFDDVALILGRNVMRGALNVYAECVRTGQWPGFGPEIEAVHLPPWFLRLYGEEPE